MRTRNNKRCTKGYYEEERDKYMMTAPTKPSRKEDGVLVRPEESRRIDMKNQCNFGGDESPEEGELSPTLYQTYLWAVANDPTTLSSDRLREGLKAWVTASSYMSPAAAAALMEVKSTRANLRSGEYQRCIQQTISDVLEQAETVFVSLSEEEQCSIEQFELQQRLLALRRDILTDTEVIIALYDFGEAGYLDARPEVERLLKSRNPEFRSRALEVLVVCWRLSEHEETVWKFLHDASPQCRREAITYLAALYEGVSDRRILAMLAHVVMNPGEQKHIRLYAYEMFLERSGCGIEEDGIRDILNLLGRGGTFEQIPGVRWDLLKCFSD